MSDIDTDAEFSSIVSTEFLSDMEPTHDREEIVYGCRVMFYKIADPNTLMTKLIPWLTYSHSRAAQMRSELSHHMSGKQLRNLIDYDPLVWIPQAVRVARLTEIPF